MENCSFYIKYILIKSMVSNHNLHIFDLIWNSVGYSLTVLNLIIT